MVPRLSFLPRRTCFLLSFTDGWGAGPQIHDSVTPEFGNVYWSQLFIQTLGGVGGSPFNAGYRKHNIVYIHIATHFPFFSIDKSSRSFHSNTLCFLKVHIVMNLCNSFFLNRHLACYQFLLPKPWMKTQITTYRANKPIQIMFFSNLNYFLILSSNIFRKDCTNWVMVRLTNNRTNTLGIIIKIHKWPVGSGEGLLMFPSLTHRVLPLDDHCPDLFFVPLSSIIFH